MLFRLFLVVSKIALVLANNIPNDLFSGIIKNAHQGSCMVLDFNPQVTSTKRLVEFLIQSPQITDIWLVSNEGQEQEVNVKSKDDIKETNCLILVSTQSELVKLQETFTKQRISKSLTFLILTEGSNEAMSLPLPVSRKAIAVTSRTNQNGFIIHLKCPHETKMNEVNVFDNVKGFLLDINNLECPVKTSLSGKTFKASYDGVRPWVVQGGASQAEKIPPWLQKDGEVIGVDIFIIETIAQHLGFKIDWKKEKFVGGPGKNGIWSGTTGSVQTSESVFGVGAIAITSGRYKVVDFTSYAYPKELSFMVRKAQPVDSFYQVVYPLSLDVWIGVLSSALIVAITLYLLHNLYLIWDSKTKGYIPGLSDFVIFIPLLIVTSQTFTWLNQRLNRFTGGYLLLGIWLLCGLNLMESYRGNLRASLMAVEYEKEVDTIKDFVARGVPGWAPSGTQLVEQMATSPFEERRQLLKESNESGKRQKTRGMPSVVMNDIVVNGSGSIVDSTVYSHVVDRYYDIHKTQPFHRLQEKWLSLMCGYIMPLERRDQVLAMNSVVDRLVDSGIVQKFFRGMLKFDSKILDEQKTQDSSESKEAKLTILHFTSTFLFWTLMAMVSVIVFFLEVLADLSRNKSKLDNNI